jgi:medium-chain acyl-[acyl-carrier-protein] hydrolase
MSRWIHCFHPRSSASVRLFCFPYAGGNAALFQSWSKNLPEQIELCAIQLPGRGDRLKELPFQSLADLVTALLPILPPYLDRPYALLGHSMGALISFEVARQLQFHQPSPHPLKHLFVSGRRAPHLPGRLPHLHQLSDREFLEELSYLNGTPAEVLNNAELMQFFLPTLRSDFSICETYRYVKGVPLTCPITVFGGVDDSIEPVDLMPGWNLQTQCQTLIEKVPGGHFFIQSQQQRILATIVSCLGKRQGNCDNLRTL